MPVPTTDPIFVYGTGPHDATIMLVGEAWGANEEREGRPFCGTSADELNRFLSSIRVSRDECYTTNVVNERPPGNADPTPEMIAAHEARLCEELLLVRPRYVVTLGRYSMWWFLGSHARLEREWGIPHTIRICEHGLPFTHDEPCAWCHVDDAATWNAVVCPQYHPAYGLYQPDDQILIQEGFEGRMGLSWGLARVIRGQIPPHPPVDQYPHPDYAELESAGDVLRWLSGSPDVVAIDTEGSISEPWCLTAAHVPGASRLISARNKRAVALLSEYVADTNPLVPMHWAGYDLQVLQTMGIMPQRIADTMLIAYELGPMFPQALKVLAYRLLGKHMRDYDDLTGEADRALATEYLERVLREGRCGRCNGRGVRAWREPVQIIPAHVRMVTTKHGSAQRRMKEKVVKAHYDWAVCDECEGDRTLWPKPRALTVWENGKLSVWQPSRVGARVRRILADVRAGKVNKKGEPTDPRERWEDADPPEAIEPVTRALGHMPAATLDMVPRAEVIEYACADADATLRVWQLLDPLIDEWELRGTCDTDLAIIPLLVEMEHTGVEVDTAYFTELSAEWKAEMARLRHRIQKLVGYYVNPASSKQVANLLFKRLNLPPVKLTKSKLGESTDDKVLEQLRITTNHPVIPLLQRHREIHKLDGTYAEPLSHVDSTDGRVRMEMKYTRTGTGRIASSKPRSGRNKHNWIQGQNIPVRGDEGKRIRTGFVAREGYLLGSWDLSQIEWRIAAHLSQDSNLLAVFREGHDLHRMTAAKMNGVAIEDVTVDQRYAAKRVGFGMGYQATWRAIKQQFALEGIELTQPEAQAFIDAFLRAYPDLPVFWQHISMNARRYGLVRSADGRIRWATAARCCASWVREAAERELGNHPVQGFAAWVLKRCLIETDRRVVQPMRRVGIDVRVWLTVHDSIEMEFPEGAEAMIDPLMKRVMRETVLLSVPVEGEGKWGKTWQDCK